MWAIWGSKHRLSGNCIAVITLCQAASQNERKLGIDTEWCTEGDFQVVGRAETALLKYTATDKEGVFLI